VKRILALACVAVACAYAWVAFVYRPGACSRTLRQVRVSTRTARQLDSYRAVLLARENLARLRRIEGPCRATVNLYTIEAENEDILEQKEEVLKSLRRALTVDQRPELYVMIGNVLIELGRLDEAVEPFVTAAKLNPVVLDEITAEEVKKRVEERLGRKAGGG